MTADNIMVEIELIDRNPSPLSQEGSVSQLRFAPGGNVLAAVCGSGHVAFWELNLQEQGVSKVRSGAQA